MDFPHMFWELATDWYQISMLGGYFHHKKIHQLAVFDLFYRQLPTNREFIIAAGLEQAVDYLTRLRFDREAIDFILAHPSFAKYPDPEGFRAYLQTFRFTGLVLAVPEGTPVAPNEPMLEVIAPLGQAQLVETYLLSVIGHQSVIASKAARVVQAAQGRPVVDFGTRRAHGREAAVLGARAAFIAGCTGTSNVLAGKLFGIPVVGTQAHAWIQSFPTELDAFRAYAATYPDNNTLLIDTYDIAEGTRHAAQVGQELQKNGHALGGVRIDSGDLSVEIPKVRKILDEEGQRSTKIVVSNDLNEYKIGDLAKQGPDHMADIFGVGTEMIVARDDPALSVVYKLVEIDGQPCIKLSSGKVTYPGRKQVFRTKDGDVLAAGGEDLPGSALLRPVLVDGALVAPLPKLTEIQQYCLDAIKNMPKPLKMSASPKLTNLVETLKAKYAGTKPKHVGKKATKKGKSHL